MTLSSSFGNNPDLDSWLQFHRDGRITVSTGKVELGQKLTTALTVIVAEELDVDPGRITVLTADTDNSPNEGYTAGSNSLESSGIALRQASAKARRALMEKASEHLEEPVENLSVTDGEIGGTTTNKYVTYWDLIGDKHFKITVTDDVLPKSPDQYHLIGNPVPAVGLEALVTGTMTYVHDMEFTDMAHARVIRPPNYHAQIQDLNDTEVRAMPGVIEVILDGSFLSVVCEREEQAIWAASKLARITVWDESKELNSKDIFVQLKNNPRQSLPVVEGVAKESPVQPFRPPENSSKTLSATYQRPYHMHGSIGPSAAIALYDAQVLKVWTHSQGIFPLRLALADVLGLAEDKIHLVHVPGAGCYGHNGADDVALDAALAARAVPGRPIMLKWERADEHAWEPFGSAMQIELQASLDDTGRVIYWNHETFSDTHMSRPSAHRENSRLLAAWHLQSPRPAPPVKPTPGFHTGIHRNADPIYDFADRRVVKHLVHDLPLRVSALRSLGAYANVFAIESFMDELAHFRDMDPLEFRLAHLSDNRARAVLEAATSKANSGFSSADDGHGRGLAVARYKNSKCYVAVVIDLIVDDYGAIQLLRAVIAADAGQIVDPDGLRNQLEGGLMQSASWTLKEQVKFDDKGIVSRDWESYPILTFAEVPEIETVLIDRPDQPFLGSGEATQGPTAAAIGNAIFYAIGLRLRRIPFTQDRVRDAAAEV
ncbi:MAG: xanthine dehydrogenase family protein molybdopterin-binding subunit [SAR324 cluster bacterium]|nr:xanthine dehydrogenase family protein molybdopterin-binding subunit [SAR324 cluster bacterium]